MADSSVNGSVQSAISFLRDPSVASAPLTKKISFLEAKGLTQADIETALRLAGTASVGGSASGYPAIPPAQYRGGVYGQSAGAFPNEWHPDWRDWFIVAVVSGSVGAGLYSLAKVRCWHDHRQEAGPVTGHIGRGFTWHGSWMFGIEY